MAIQVHSGFGYWNVLSWALFFVMALIIVLVLTGVGRHERGPRAPSKAPLPPFSLEMSLLKGSFKGWEPLLFPDRVGVVVLLTALLLAAVLLGGGPR